MKRNKGFTLIELIVVIAILAILALLIVPQVTGYVSQSQKVTCDTNRSTLERELLMKNMTDSSNYPVNATGYQKLIEDHGGNVECPAGGTYSWYATGDNSGYIVCSKHGHGDGIGSNATTGGTGTKTDGKSVVATDSSGKTHTITAEYTEWSQVESLIKGYSGVNLVNGSTYYDGNNLYVCAGWADHIADPDGTMTWESFISATQDLVKIDSSTKIYDSTDLSNENSEHWKGTPPKRGSLYYNSTDDKIYVVAQDCGEGDTPKLTSLWFALK